MRIRKYDFNYSRRAFLDKMATGAMAAGVLGPLWPLIARAGDITKAGETLKRYKEKPVVVCCESGPRGRSALAALQDQGFKQVVNLKGGMRAWRAEHLPVARD